MAVLYPPPPKPVDSSFDPPDKFEEVKYIDLSFEQQPTKKKGCVP